LIQKAQRQFEMQADRNQKEFGDEGELARHSYEGFRQGLYVRIHLKGVPTEFLRCFEPHRPIIVGGLLPSETSMGFITARLKRHRWHKRILKSQDPIIFSMGWRRFQVNRFSFQFKKGHFNLFIASYSCSFLFFYESFV
jgi:ribosome biogenesis protein BMS1